MTKKKGPNSETTQYAFKTASGSTTPSSASMHSMRCFTTTNSDFLEKWWRTQPSHWYSIAFQSGRHFHATSLWQPLRLCTEIRRALKPRVHCGYRTDSTRRFHQVRGPHIRGNIKLSTPKALIQPAPLTIVTVLFQYQAGKGAVGNLNKLPLPPRSFYLNATTAS